MYKRLIFNNSVFRQVQFQMSYRCQNFIKIRISKLPANNINCSQIIENLFLHYKKWKTNIYIYIYIYTCQGFDSWPLSLFLFFRPRLIHARLPERGRARIHGSRSMTVVVGLLHGATFQSNLTLVLFVSIIRP